MDILATQWEVAPDQDPIFQEGIHVHKETFAERCCKNVTNGNEQFAAEEPQIAHDRFYNAKFLLTPACTNQVKSDNEAKFFNF